MTQAEFMEMAKSTVFSYYAERGQFLRDVFIVWYCKTLQNHKTILFSPDAQGMLFEFTYNGDKDEAYLDVYGKNENIVCRRLEDE